MINRKIRLSAAAFALISLGYPASVFAQQPSEETVEEIVVTGSRMRGAEAPVGSPIISMDRERISTSTAVSVDQMIKEIPQVFNLGISDASRGQSGGSGNIVWANSVNLRGIGPYATLVLVDGHRVNSNARSIDPSILPSLALERVEVVADGASAIYGSDAISGVVNLITRREVDGLEFIAQRGVGSDYDEYKAGIAWGTTWDGGSVFIAAERGKRSAINGTDRDYFTSDQRPSADYRVRQCAPGNITANGQSYAIPEGGVTPANAGSLTAGTANLCDALAYQDLLPEQEYTNLAFTSTFDASENLSFYLDGFFSNRDFHRDSSPATGSLQVPSTNAFYADPTGTSPASLMVDYSFANDLPGDDQDGYQRNWELTTGVKWDIAGSWRLEALATYGDLREVSETLTGINNTALTAALASSDPATAFDPFGLYRTSPAVLAAISDQIFIADTSNELFAYELRANGDLFELPGGTVQLAVGYEGQEQTNEPGTQRGGPAALNVVQHYERDVDSYYGEVLIPIIGAGNSLPAVQSLELNLAVRQDKYSDVGSTTNPKYGITWAPTEDLKLRASYGTSFRAPLFSQLYGNSSALYGQDYSDPTQGGAVVRGFALSGGNVDLEPEEAETWTAGFDYSPAALPGLNLSVTYFDVLYEGQIETYLSDLSVLSLEDEFAGTGVILRGAEADARVQALLAQGFTVARGWPLPVPVTLFIDGRTNNLGRSETKGFDFSVNYGWSLDDFGNLDLNVGGMYVDSYEVAITPTGNMEDRRNTIFNPLSLKTRSSLRWTLDQFSTRLTWNHVNSYTNDRIANPETVSAFNTFDLGLAMNLGEPGSGGFLDGLILSLDVNNLLDEEPPYVRLAPSVNGGGGYDPSAASPFGRVMSLSIRKTL